jgi:arylsulfatase A-like enzyme
MPRNLDRLEKDGWPYVALIAFLFLFISSSVASAKPNIIVIFADDLGYADLSCQGSREVKTPRIDSIAANGIRFTAGYVTAPQCSPSRAGMLTGIYQQRFGHENNMTMDAALSTGARLLPENLKPAGYLTAHFGKWHLGDTKPGHQPVDHGFDESFGFPEFSKADQGGKLSLDGKSVRGERYRNGVILERAAQFIEEHAKESFFLYVAPISPHVPQVYSPKYEAVFQQATGDDARRHCIAMMSELDDGVGKILDALRKTRLEENTLLFFISDNGGQPPSNASINDPLRGKKGDLWEGGIRVPFLLQWKGVLPSGRVYENPVISLDVVPTALAAAGAKELTGVTLDGVNLLPFLNLNAKTKGAPHTHLFWRWRLRDDSPQCALRDGDWKWVRMGEAAPELYRIGNDISETNNLAAIEPQKLKELGEAWEAWNKQMPPMAELDDRKAAREGKKNRRAK